MEGLKIRKLADKSEGERITVPVLETVELRNGEKVQVHTGQVKLVNPDTPGVDHEPWPLAGVKLEIAPDECRLSTSFVDRGINEGWLEGFGESLIRRPAGPADNPTRAWHYFTHYDELVFHTVDGDVTYRVTRQPDKYVEGDETGVMSVTDEFYRSGETQVDHFYAVEKVN
jgi:hypothetical protein